MNATEYVEALYRLVLKRKPESEGVRYWSQRIEQGENSMAIFAAFLDSDEYRQQHSSGEIEVAAEGLAELRAALGPARTLRIVDIGAQVLNWEDHVYQPLLSAGFPCEIIGFDPLAERLKERAQQEKDVRLTLLPFAIGDGRRHTLHINNDDGTSSLLPLNPEASRTFAALEGLKTVRTETVDTRRLDDVIHGDVDFLKLDIQGFELRALESATETLFRTAVVHCEVEFYPLYTGQPLFPQIHSFLTTRGFEFIDIVKPMRLSNPVPSGRKGPERLVFADAVFFRKPQTSDRDLLLVQAIVALLVYQKPVLAEWLLREHNPALSVFRER